MMAFIGGSASAKCAQLRSYLLLRWKPKDISPASSFKDGTLLEAQNGSVGNFVRLIVME
jgi:hypothetical protein